MNLLAGKIPTLVMKGINASDGALLGCPVCGWWAALSLRGAAPYETHDGGFAELRQISGVLKNLDLTDLSIPLHELRSYLIARYGDRFIVHPRKYEEIVGGVFSDFGYQVRVTSYSGDEGIDIFVLDGKGDATVGVQVKRYQNKISAEQIRSFVGALALQGLTTGIYVTTSDYEKGAKQAAAAAGSRLGIGITLLDAKRFYEALRISARATLWDAEDSASPYYKCWQGVKEYVSGPPLPRGERAKSWLETADYVWGSSW
jgi:restriction system protein